MKSEEILDFHIIKERLANMCPSVISKELAMEITILRDGQKIQEALQETGEAKLSLEREIEQPIGGTRDIRQACSKSRKDIVLLREELWDIYMTIQAYRRMYRFFRDKYLEYPLLSLWIQDMKLHDQIEKKFERMFDKHGVLLDSATPKLQNLRMLIGRTKDRIKSELQAILQDKENQKYFQETIVTQRNDRYVIPVKQEYRSVFEGLIHDRSATGATLYIEPMKLVNLNNDLQEAIREEEQEVQRIYKELTALIKQHANTLMDACDRVSHVEFVYGKAQLALSMKGVAAELSGGREVKILNGRHPLIAPQSVVPTTIILGTNYKILLITGSNTGGKTVSMKTLGLLSMMNQAGLYIPADQGSILPIFHNIYADIGDEQSIEMSLSTFSAHMTHVIDIIKHVGPNDLVLLDEIGSGTDPEEGSALAIAILEHFRRKGPLMMVSTHYNELKNYAYHTKGIENGHVEFDERTLRPTYRLHIGVAGSSHALSIAERLGLPKEVVAEARKQRALSERSDMEELLGELNEQLRRTKEKDRALKKEISEVRRLKAQVDKEKQQIQEKKQKILSRAQEEAQALKTSLRVEGEQIIKELKNQFSEGNKGKRQEAIIKARKGISNVYIPTSDKEVRPAVDVSSLKVGDKVFVNTIGSNGTVLSIQGKKVQVDVNGLTANVKGSDLSILSREELNAMIRKEKPPTIKERKRSGMAILRKQQASTELNIIGKMVDEATILVGQFIDQAILAGLTSVRIIHGKGTGALRAGVHEYLRHLPQVKHFETAGYDEGGAGATTVVLK